MAKRQISIRVSADVLERVEAYASDAGVTRAAAIERLLVAGLERDLLVTERDTDCDTRDTGRDQSVTDNSGELLAVLRESNVDLRMTVSTLTAQLAVKDEQIASLTGLADHAQRLHAMSETKALAPAEADRLTFGERWRRWWSGRS